MKQWILIPTLLIAPLAVRQLHAATDKGRELVRQSIQNYEHDWREGMKWSYTQNDVMHKDGGALTEVSEIGPLYGTPYERLISRDGKVPPQLKQREDEKFRKVSQERRGESPQKQAARIKKYASDRSFFNEIPEAYDFKIVGEPLVEGRPTWQILMTPHPGYIPKTARSSMLKHIEGTLWIDKADVRWARAEAKVIDTVSIGWIVARVGQGAEFSLNQTRVKPNFWMPKVIDVKAVAKVMMVHNKDLTEHLTYSNYHLEAAPQAVTQAKPTVHSAKPAAFK